MNVNTANLTQILPFAHIPKTFGLPKSNETTSTTEKTTTIEEEKEKDSPTKTNTTATAANPISEEDEEEGCEFGIWENGKCVNESVYVDIFNTMLMFH